MYTKGLSQVNKILFFFALVFTALYFSKPFLAPFAIAGILSMLFLPLANKLEHKGISRGFSTLISTTLLITFIAGLFILLSTQLAGLSEDLPSIKENINKTIEQIKAYISNSLGISLAKQEQVLAQQKSSNSGQTSALITATLSFLFSILVDTILVLVYIFLLMFYRTKLKKFILKLVPDVRNSQTSYIIHQSSKVAAKYLIGLGTMIVMLWIMYGIGFTIIGVKNAIFFAVLCGVLEIIPFVGNVTGTGLTLLMGLSQGGGSSIIIGILVTYAIVQFVQTYILEPLVVGSEVNINPLFTILVIVIGELVWGVAGMVLAIPTLGIIKVICDNVETLKPYGYLIGEDKKESKLKEKIKSLFKKK